jgi:hypothetical protein
MILQLATVLAGIMLGAAIISSRNFRTICFNAWGWTIVGALGIWFLVNKEPRTNEDKFVAITTIPTPPALMSNENFISNSSLQEDLVVKTDKEFSLGKACDSAWIQEGREAYRLCIENQLRRR